MPANEEMQSIKAADRTSRFRLLMYSYPFVRVGQITPLQPEHACNHTITNSGNCLFDHADIHYRLL
jgi:hypothetical protein